MTHPSKPPDTTAEAHSGIGPKNNTTHRLNEQRRPVLIVGCGDIGLRVAALESAAGHPISALARSDASASKLAAQGIAVLRGDLDRADSLCIPEHGAPLLYYFAPPPANGTDDSRIARWIEVLTPDRSPECLVYISTSGVYGDCQGAWVSEERPLKPCSDRARRRLDAENRLREWSASRQCRLVMLRVPGIYGPNRLPVERIRQGIPVLREEESPFSNRIHADDLAAACLAAARLGQSGQAYNIADGHPTTMTDFFFRLADALGLPRPPTVTMEEARVSLSPGMLSFLDESKRLVNRRMLDQLQVRLRYADLDAGLAASLPEADRNAPIGLRPSA
jgi:nucleoside-diphosphate-sugar epimerase